VSADGEADGKGQAAKAIFHASCVAVDGRGLLIFGPSGSGKSTLALQMIALGASLVSDDRTFLEVEAGRVIARAPDRIMGQIEARGIGILSAPAIAQARVALICDMAQTEPERLPPARDRDLFGVRLPLVHGAGNPHLAAGLLLYLRGGGRVA
jgi:HPr kinase/phosphorylase